MKEPAPGVREPDESVESRKILSAVAEIFVNLIIRPVKQRA
jgi:hypothetical protein